MMKKTELSILLLLAIVLSGCQPGKQETELKGEAQGTSYHIKLVLDGLPVTAERVQNEVSTVLADIDAKLSNHRDDSEISRINTQETTDWLPVSGEIAQLVSIAHTVYEHSDGCYDLTVKPLFDLWGFSHHENRIPAQEEIDALLPHVGMPLLEVDAAGQRIRKKDPKLKIDLSSIAQAYSVGVVARRLEGFGISNYWVEIGGDIMVKGHRANGYNWWVSMDTPKPLTTELQQLVYDREESGVAFMTAGNYRNSFLENGQNHSLILNPKTGRPVVYDLRSVTVMHDDPALADAWNTALLCVGKQEAARIADAENLKVLLTYGDGNEPMEHLSKAFVASP